MSEHEQTVQREFARQAKTFEDPSYSFADRRLLGWISEHVPTERGGGVLDVAGGTGHMARMYADAAAVAVVLDLTPEMLATGRREAEAVGMRNLVRSRRRGADALSRRVLRPGDKPLCRASLRQR
jgi:ubiquinone/menaquinone biosynthesis C-methylase UbiE